MTQTRTAPSRIQKPIQYNFQSRESALLYRPDGKRYTLTLWPPIDTNFPVFESTFEAPAGAPKTHPVHAAYYAKWEVAGQTVPFVVLHLSGPGGFSTHSFELDASGKISGSIVEDGINEPRESMSILVSKLDFEMFGKKLDPAQFKTTVEAPDLVAMTQRWTATITAPGLPAFTASGDASALRKSGIDPAKFSYWKTVHVWERTTTTGANLPVILAESSEGFTVICHTPDKVVINAQTPKTFTAAIRAANSVLQGFQNA